MKVLRTALWVVAVSGLAAPSCGGQEAPPAPPQADPVVVRAPPKPPEPARPKDEAALAQAFAAALEARDIDAAAALAAPELAADLRRMHGADAEAFWARGQVFVTNARSGLAVAAKDEAKDDRWRVLLRFGNGEEESVVVGRVEGRLVFAAL